MNPFLAIIIANIIFGTTSPIMKMGLTEIPPALLGFIRFASAALILAPFAISRWNPLSRKNWMILILAGICGVGIHIGLFFLGLQLTQSIVGPVIASSGPVILYAMSLVFLKEKFMLRKFNGMLVALAGVLVIVLAPLALNGTEVHHQQTLGNVLIFLATIFGILHSLLIKKITEKISAIQMSVIVFVTGSLCFLPFTFGEIQNWSIESVTAKGWFALLFGSIFVCVGGYTLFHYALTKIDASDVGMFTYMDPVIALVVAWPLLGEKPDIFYFLGSVLVFGGIYIAERRIHWHPFHKLRNYN